MWGVIVTVVTAPLYNKLPEQVHTKINTKSSPSIVEDYDVYLHKVPPVKFEEFLKIDNLIS